MLYVISLILASMKKAASRLYSVTRSSLRRLKELFALVVALQSLISLAPRMARSLVQASLRLCFLIRLVKLHLNSMVCVLGSVASHSMYMSILTIYFHL